MKRIRALQFLAFALATPSHRAAAQVPPPQASEKPEVVFAELVPMRGQTPVNTTAQLLTDALAQALARDSSIQFARGSRVYVDSVLARGGYMVYGGVAALRGQIFATVRLLGPNRRGFALSDSIPAFGPAHTTATYEAALRLAAGISARVALRR